MYTREFGGKASVEGVHMLKNTGSRYTEGFAGSQADVAAICGRPSRQCRNDSLP